MTAELLILTKGFSALIFSGIFAWIVFDRDFGDADSDRQKYMPYISGSLLPMLMLTILIFAFIFNEWEIAMKFTLAFCFAVFLHTCLYYLLLMPALPFLRRHISARACAMLWMLPNYLYFTQMSYMKLPGPRWVIEAPITLVWVLLAVWLAGFLAVLGWKIASHLTFRARILHHASPVDDPAILAVWQGEVEKARFRKPKFKLVASPDVQTPLSVGLFQRAVRVVLPERHYTPEELALIFRHELVHIGREDSWNKFFLVFCSAMCWFNPLMWVAARKSSDDLELSCDETVLLGADDDTKRRYANLLLKTAGDEQGFTTCLSASANAMRYRLKSVVEPKEKPSGALVVGLVFFLLCMSCGYVALAYGETTGAEAIYQSQAPEQFELRNERLHNFICTDEAALHRYLSALRMEQISGNYSFDQEGKSLFLMFRTPDDTLGVTLLDRYIKLARIHGEVGTEYYYLPDGTDWDALDECIFECPGLKVLITGTEDSFRQNLNVFPSRVCLVEGDSTEVLYEMDPYDTPSGIYGSWPCQAVVSFDPPLNGDCEVEIAPLDGGSGRTVTVDSHMTVSLPREAARYTVSGEFDGKDGKLYQIEFQFEIGDL